MKTTYYTPAISLMEKLQNEHRSADKCVSEQQQIYCIELAKQGTIVLGIS
jgi:hypothetical protein